MDRFDDEPAKQEVVRFLLQHGYAVDEENGINTNGMSLSDSDIAATLGVDRRVVSKTAETICQDDELQQIFRNLSSVPFLENTADVLGLSVITVQVDDAAETGLLADIAQVFTDYEVMIRQAVVQDPFFTEQPQFVAIIDGTPPEGMMIDLKKLEFSEGVFFG
jgi:predicted regulator of amino acid metabolism with ACT domain